LRGRISSLVNGMWTRNAASGILPGPAKELSSFVDVPHLVGTQVNFPKGLLLASRAVNEVEGDLVDMLIRPLAGSPTLCPPHFRGESRNIPPNYADTRSSLSEAEKARCNREREEYMCAKILAEAGGRESILVICGRTHAGAIAGKLRELGHSVETTDLQDQPWYIEDWAEHCMRNL